MRVYKHKQKDKGGNWQPSKKWYIDFRDHQGRLRTIVGFKEKRASEDLGRFIETLVDVKAGGGVLDKATRDRTNKLGPRLLKRLIKLDILDSNHAQRLKNVDEHLADYIQSLRDKQRNEVYVRNVESRTNDLLRRCGCKSLPLPSPAAIQSALAKLREEDELAAQTLNHYLTAFKQFAKWLHDEGRAAAVNYGSVSRYHVESDQRHPRRALTDEECLALIKTAAVGPVRHRMNGTERATLYLAAITTGLRASELRRLVVSDLRQDETGMHLLVRAHRGKNKRNVRQPLSDDVGAALKGLVDGKEDSCELFPMPTADHTAKMLRADLEAAGIPYIDADGNYADFHALRHTFVTRLVSSGADAKIVQQLARHTTLQLTLGRYAHASKTALKDVVANAPSLTTAFEHAQPEMLIDAGSDESLPQDLLLTGDSTRTSANSDEQEDEIEVHGESAQESSVSAGNAPTEGAGTIIISTGTEVAEVAFKTDAIGHSATPPTCTE